MRRAATVGLLLACGLGGGCAEFDDWMEPEHTSEYRRGGYTRDDRATPPPPALPSDQGPGVYADK